VADSALDRVGEAAPPPPVAAASEDGGRAPPLPVGAGSTARQARDAPVRGGPGEEKGTRRQGGRVLEEPRKVCMQSFP
jgi:hypothetical protein